MLREAAPPVETVPVEDRVEREEEGFVIDEGGARLRPPVIERVEGAHAPGIEHHPRQVEGNAALPARGNGERRGRFLVAIGMLAAIDHARPSPLPRDRQSIQATL